MRLSVANDRRDYFLKTSLITFLLALSITGCDQIIQRLGNKSANNPLITLPETTKEPPPESNTQTEIPAKIVERKGNRKPAELTKSREEALSSETSRTQQQETVGIDSKNKSTIQKKKRADAKPSEVGEAETGTVRRGNVSREY